jgi:hypothetical protein
MSPADHGRLAELEEQNRRLKTENEFLQYPRLGSGLSEKSALIEAEKANFPIEWMCAQLSVPRSSFYAWRVRADKLTATQARREALGVEIERVFHDQRGTAGCPDLPGPAGAVGGGEKFLLRAVGACLRAAVAEADCETQL